MSLNLRSNVFEVYLEIGILCWTANHHDRTTSSGGKRARARQHDFLGFPLFHFRSKMGRDL